MAVADQKREESKGLQCCIARGVGAVEDAKRERPLSPGFEVLPKGPVPSLVRSSFEGLQPGSCRVGLR